MSRRRRGDAVDGVLVVDKPAGQTSNGVLQQVRHKLNAARGGHTGSLDPLATGVLPLCFGEATKFAQQVLEADKTYLTRARLGVRTTTSDADGEPVQERPVPEGLSRADVEAVLERFRGEQKQTPSMYSALKYQGRPLYAYAREGRTVPREARPIHIRELSLIEHEGEDLVLRVRCTKGTYIRTLVDDIGEALGCGAHVAELRREAAGPFTLGEAVTPAELEELSRDELRQRLVPADRLLSALSMITLDGVQAVSISNGQAVTIAASSAESSVESGLLRLYEGERFLGLGELNQGVVRPRRLMRTEN
ncbi:tRNA pseudouridine synthase B [Halospina denitrificans]|uniref:tRNA pseudouridine synthase B n=1 Tax=Halospina denitrificans TaxID=332522 RepID=A0A4R7K100_9GAMM|nr:tRNA pseudouridine(55) synthase TruB [Halospina denitrificans]TDT43563.1 tRNA pseudouridine synthase B [Halospina denitrificans]